MAREKKTEEPMATSYRQDSTTKREANVSLQILYYLSKNSLFFGTAIVSTTRPSYHNQPTNQPKTASKVSTISTNANALQSKVPWL